MKRKATIKDVAELAGVSKSTISYVLSGKRPIGKEVTERVHAAMKKLEYKPSILARNLAEQHTRTIGLYGPSTENLREDLFFNLILSGILDLTNQKDYRLMLYTEKKDKDNQVFFDLDQSQPIDGALIMNPDLDAHYFDSLKKSNIPFVLIGSGVGHSDVFYVDNDNVAVVYQAVNYLVKKGHTDILFINGPSQYVGSVDRDKGYRLALTESGVQINESLIFHADFLEEQGYNICQQAVKEGRSFTAVLAVNDIIAVGTLKALKENRIKVPNEIAVMGIGNTLVAQIHSPSITTVDMHAKDLGYNAAGLLLDVIHKNRISSCGISIPATLIERETT